MLNLRSMALCAVALTIGAATDTSASSIPVPNLVAAPVQYDIETSGWTWTKCHLINTSKTTPISIDSVDLLGPGGQGNVVATLPQYAGQVIEPLGELRIYLDDDTPGFPWPPPLPNVSVLRSIVVDYSGNDGSLHLLSIRRNHPDTDPDCQTWWRAEGFPVTD